VTNTDNLLCNNKQLMEEWDYEKNTELDPFTLTLGSSKIAFWKCKHGHSWSTKIKDRRNGLGCPYCSNRRVWKGFNDLGTTHPKLAKEWHPTKNGNMTPAKVTSGSKNKVWWICDKGHEWDSRIADRVKGDGCPYCSNKRILKGFNDLETTHPELAKEWHPTKNGDITPNDVSAGSGVKIWWICKNGHEYQSKVINRKRGHGCPYCSGNRVLVGVTDFESRHPELAKEWHPTKNGNQTPKDFTAGSSKNVWWVCDKGHEWQARINARVRGDSCPICTNHQPRFPRSNLMKENPELAKEWHPTKNGDLTPEDVSAGSGIKVWWKCKEGHEWQASVYSRFGGNSCPYCSNKRLLKGFNDLETRYPEIAKEWNSEKNGNLKPSDVLCGYSKKVWWKCTCGHEWEARIADRVRKSKCPRCSGRIAISGFNDLATKCPELVKEWHPTKNGNLKPQDITVGSGRKVWWKCKCGHEWETQVRTRVKGSGCPQCAVEKRLAKRMEKGIAKQASQTTKHQKKVIPKICKNSGTSFPQEALYYYIRKISADAENRAEIKGEEVDVYIPALNVGIEYDGMYYHSGKKAEEKEQRKNRILKESGLSLIRIKETKTESSGITFSVENDIPTFFYFPRGYHLLDKLIRDVITYVFSEEYGDVNIERDTIQILEAYRKDLAENSLAAKYPEIAREWHPTKNGKMLPNEVLSGSNHSVWWVCDKGHEWKSRIYRRVMGDGCPYCANRSVLSGFNDLQTRYPDIAKEWHPTKNGTLKPSDVTYGSIQKVWWKCKDGHEWKTRVQDRTFSGTGCPYCSGNKVLKGFNDLESQHPELAKEWHPTKNEDLRPDEISVGSGRKVWWKCEHGHEWDAVVAARVGGNGCPYCSGKKVLPGFNDLKTLRPEIAKQWHPTKNGSLRPDDVTPGSSENVWWICDKGHEYQTRVKNRKSKESCPYCSKKKLLKGFNDLATTHPELAKEWHPTKNGDLRPDEIMSGYPQKIWWKCEHGHEWESKLSNRTQGSGCPECYRLGLNKKKKAGQK